MGDQLAPATAPAPLDTSAGIPDALLGAAVTSPDPVYTVEAATSTPDPAEPAPTPPAASAERSAPEEPTTDTAPVPTDEDP